MFLHVFHFNATYFSSLLLLVSQLFRDVLLSSKSELATVFHVFYVSFHSVFTGSDRVSGMSHNVVLFEFQSYCIHEQKRQEKRFCVLLRICVDQI